MARQKRKAASTSEENVKTRKLEAVVITPTIELSSKPESGKAKQKAQATQPLSALAARRAAIESGSYNEPEEVEPDSESEAEPETPQEVTSITDEEEEEDQVSGDDIEEVEEEGEEVDPLSRGITPTNTDPSSLVEEQRPKKKKVKNPLYMDAKSVSNFTPTAHNSCILEQEGEHYLFLGLKKGEDILFLGQILAAPLYGSISVMGAIISSGREIPTELNGDEDLPTHFYPVFSTRTHSLLRISSTPLDNTPSLRQPHNEPEHIDFSLIEAVHDELKQEINEFESIVVIKDNSSSGLQSMNIQFPAYKNMFKFRKVETEQKRLNKHMAINMIRGFSPLLFEPVAGVRPFHIESSWQSRADYALKNASNDQAFTSVVCGAKDTGKSTFTKYYVNRLLSVYDCVAYIETDLGQPEFSPSGMLSLHYITQPILGPAFSHQHLEPARSFFFGSVHPKDNPDYYLACFSELVDHWQTTKHIPLVVNTQGWVSGLGYDLLMDQIQKVSPTDIFATRHAMLRYRNLPATFNADVINMIGNDAATTHSIDCVIQQTTESTLSGNYTAADHREMTLGSYFFNKRARNTDVYPKWDYHTHMMDRIPWSIDWRVGLNSIWVIYEEVKLDQLFYALNGTMIALVGDVSNFEKQKGPNNEIGENNKFIPPTYFNTQDEPLPSPSTTTCYGLGIVRTIDPSRHALLILTPVPKESLEYVSSIVRGELQLPLWAMFNYRNNNTNVSISPYLTVESTEGAGANALKVRRNLLRRQKN